MPNYTVSELREWCFAQKIFHELFSAWKVGGFETSDIPSCDRIDDAEHYRLDNLQLMTWAENDAKRSIPVIAIDINGNEVRFESQAEAMRVTGASIHGIRRALKVGNPIHHGYRWIKAKKNLHD